MKQALNLKIVLPIAALAAMVASFGGASVAHAVGTTAPITLVPSIYSGWEVDKTTGGNICTVASEHRCQSRSRASGGAGGFNYPGSVAADARTGDVYVADIANNRVQELTARGAFVAMFGWDVNRTNDGRVGAERAEKNVCTAASGDVCTVGVPGTAAGQLSSPVSVAVDPATGDVYVLEINAGDFRVDKYTSDGRFVWMIGKHVNRSTGGNICTAREIERARVRCGPGSESASGSTEPSAFKCSQQSGDLLVVGGPGNLLYIGDEQRVQVFGTDGRWKRNIVLASLSSEAHSSVLALTVDASGDLYLVYRAGAIGTYLPAERANIIHRFNSRGEQVAEYTVNAKRPGAWDTISGVAVDRSRRLAAIGVEAGIGAAPRFGLLYDANTGALISGFIPPSDNDGVAFNGAGDLYVAATDDHEIVAYAPAPLAELVTGPVPCEIQYQKGSQSAFNCAISTS